MTCSQSSHYVGRPGEPCANCGRPLQHGIVECVQTLRAEGVASERRRRELLNLLEDVWDQFCLHPDRDHPEWTMDGALGVLEDVAFTLCDAGRLERVMERPDKEWWRRPAAPRDPSTVQPQPGPPDAAQPPGEGFMKSGSVSGPDSGGTPTR